MTSPLPDRIAAAITSYWRAAVSCDQMDKTRAELDAAIAEVVAERDALRSELDSALLVLPACCGSLADAADTLRQDRDAERTRADGLAAELSQLHTWAKGWSTDEVRSCYEQRNVWRIVAEQIWGAIHRANSGQPPAQAPAAAAPAPSTAPRRCAKCGLAENEHDVRHVFVPAGGRR